jgi:hypothetical protein
MNMAKDTTPPKPQTPFERFTEAAKHVFNLPKSDVDRVKKDIPVPKTVRKSRKRN